MIIEDHNVRVQNPRNKKEAEVKIRKKERKYEKNGENSGNGEEVKKEANVMLKTQNEWDCCDEI